MKLRRRRKQKTQPPIAYEPTFGAALADYWAAQKLMYAASHITVRHDNEWLAIPKDPKRGAWFQWRLITRMGWDDSTVVYTDLNHGRSLVRSESPWYVPTEWSKA